MILVEVTLTRSTCKTLNSILNYTLSPKHEKVYQWCGIKVQLNKNEAKVNIKLWFSVYALLYHLEFNARLETFYDLSC